MRVGGGERYANVLQVKDGETGGQGLLQLIGLVRVEDTQRVQVRLAPNFELHDILGAFNLDAPGVLAASREQEVLDLHDLLGHGGGRSCTTPGG